MLDREDEREEVKEIDVDKEAVLSPPAVELVLERLRRRLCVRSSSSSVCQRLCWPSALHVLTVPESLQWFDEESGDSGLISNTGMSYFYTLVNTSKCGPTQRQARAEFIQGCKDEEGFVDQYVPPPI